jgi:hypothetical protein
VICLDARRGELRNSEVELIHLAELVDGRRLSGHFPFGDEQSLRRFEPESVNGLLDESCSRANAPKSFERMNTPRFGTREKTELVAPQR